MSDLGRLTPPDLQDAPDGFPRGAVSNLQRQTQQTSGIMLPNINRGAFPMDEARRVAHESFTASTNWLNAGRRAAWADALRAFQSKHSSGSKYLSRDYAYRSNLFRPKTRAMVRADEAQTAAAFFANEDVVSITPGDPDDQFQVASAELMQQLLQYRLTKTIPWFLTVVGARQDGEVQGVCAMRAGWLYEEKMSHTEQRLKIGADGAITSDDVDIMRKVKDEPFVTLLAPENIRIEPGADWRTPVQSSPYVIEMIPMYIEDVRDKMDRGEWFEVSDSGLRAAGDRADDTTRRAREQGRVPGKDADAWKPRAYEICWVHRNIIRRHGEDWHYFTLGGVGEMLTEPAPLAEVELHGERPYVLGYVVVETHKTYPSGKVELVTDLQRAANDDWNLRFDNLKLSLNPRQFVRAGAGFEQQDLTRFAPGRVVIADIAKTEPLSNAVLWDRPPSPDAAAYAEQDKINADWDQLSGSFGAESVQATAMREAPATGMHLLSGAAAGMNEYELRVFAETAIEPLLRLLVKIEQAYETDPVILALAGRKAQLLQKFGLNHITDELLQQELTTRVNVGIGATNPALKLRNLGGTAQMIGSIFGPIAAQKVDFDEIFKEAMSLAGYKDGKRFLRDGPSVQEMQLQQQLQKLQGKGTGGQDGASKVQTAQITAQSRLQEQAMQNQNDQRSDQMEFQREKMQEDAENWRTWVKYQSEQQNAAHDRAHDVGMAHVQQMHAAGMSDVDRAHQERQAGAQMEHQRQMKPPAVADDVPPAHLLPKKEGGVVHFSNGQKWSRRGGQHVRVG